MEKVSNKIIVINDEVHKNKIIISGKSYNIHPVYSLYAGSEDGYIIHIIKQSPMKGSMTNTGYLKISIRKHGKNNQRGYSAHRFIWECYNGIIQDDKVIDHINNNKEDNRLCNLQLVTQQQNCKKSAKNRDYSFAAKNHQNKKCVKATNCETNEETFYNSMYAVQQHLGINCGIVKMVCEGLNNVKSGKSKKDNCKYKFMYITKEELPENYKKSANKRPNKRKKQDNQKQ